MSSYFIALNNHSDITFINGVLANVGWIRKTFDAVFVECMARNHSIHDFIDHHIKTFLVEAKIEHALLETTHFTQAERNAVRCLNTLQIAQTYSLSAKFEYTQLFIRKMNVLNKLVQLMRQTQVPWDIRAHDYEYPLFGMKTLVIYQAILQSKNIKFIGVEPPDYDANISTHSDEARDQSIIQILLNERVRQTVRNGFFLLGMNHAMNLLEYACCAGRGGFRFCRVIGDELTPLETHSRAAQMYQHNLRRGCGYTVHLGYGNSFDVFYPKGENPQYSQADFNRDFPTLYKPWHGTSVEPLPQSRSDEYGNVQTALHHWIPSKRSEEIERREIERRKNNIA